MAADPQPARDPNGAVPPGRNLLWSALSLVIVALAGAALVAVTADWSAGPIAENRAAQIMKTLGPLLEAVPYDNAPYDDTIEFSDVELLGGPGSHTVYRARLDGRVTAVVISATAPRGYVGPIRLLIAVRPDGSLLGVVPVEHRETPGLGDKIEPGRSGWIRQFRDKSLDAPPPGDWRLRRDNGGFDRITGATITSRAVLNAVADALRFFERERGRLLAGQSQETSAAVAD